MGTDQRSNLRATWCQRMTPYEIYGVNYAHYSLENFQIKLMQLSNQLKLMYETDLVNTQVQTLID